jgi:hypothetical protein
MRYQILDARLKANLLKLIRYLLVIFFVSSFHFATAQTQTPFVFPKKKIVDNVTDTTLYPIRGDFKISESGFGIYKTLDFWVFDAKDREVYHVTQGIPTGDAFAHIVYKLIDREYTEFMMKHGHVMCKK